MNKQPGFLAHILNLAARDGLARGTEKNATTIRLNSHEYVEARCVPFAESDSANRNEWINWIFRESVHAFPLTKALSFIDRLELVNTTL